MKTLPTLLLALAIATLPLVTACWQCEGGASWTPYARDVAAVTLDADAPVIVPLTVGATTAPTMDSVAVEIAMTDCSAGSFDVGVRMLRADGTEIIATDGFTTTAAAPRQLRCPGRGVVFELAPSELTCADNRCTASFDVELTASTSVGPREVEVHLVTSECRSHQARNDGAIDAWGE